MKYADLHTHSFFSDGTLSPAEVVRLAREAGLDAVALADHDTVAGLGEARSAAEAHGIELIPAIEMSCEHDGKEIHLLGYFIDCGNPALTAAIDTMRRNRIERIYAMTQRLKAMGVALDPEGVVRLAKKGTVGRMHLARALVSAGAAGSLPEAFDRFIGDSSPAYVAGFRLSPLQAISIIREARGVAVLAHPYLIRNDDFIMDAVRWGIGGIEVFYPEHTQSMINFYTRLAREHGLATTGGSDFHGKVKPEVRLGMIKVPYDCVEDLRRRAG